MVCLDPADDAIYDGMPGAHAGYRITKEQYGADPPSAKQVELDTFSHSQSLVSYIDGL